MSVDSAPLPFPEFHDGCVDVPSNPSTGLGTPQYANLGGMPFLNNYSMVPKGQAPTIYSTSTNSVYTLQAVSATSVPPGVSTQLSPVNTLPGGPLLLASPAGQADSLRWIGGGAPQAPPAAAAAAAGHGGQQQSDGGSLPMPVIFPPFGGSPVASAPLSQNCAGAGASSSSNGTELVLPTPSLSMGNTTASSISSIPAAGFSLTHPMAATMHPGMPFLCGPTTGTAQHLLVAPQPAVPMRPAAGTPTTHMHFLASSQPFTPTSLSGYSVSPGLSNGMPMPGWIGGVPLQPTVWAGAGPHPQSPLSPQSPLTPLQQQNKTSLSPPPLHNNVNFTDVQSVGSGSAALPAACLSCGGGGMDSSTAESTTPALSASADPPVVGGSASNDNRKAKGGMRPPSVSHGTGGGGGGNNNTAGKGKPRGSTAVTTTPKGAVGTANTVRHTASPSTAESFTMHGWSYPAGLNRKARRRILHKLEGPDEHPAAVYVGEDVANDGVEMGEDVDTPTEGGSGSSTAATPTEDEISSEEEAAVDVGGVTASGRKRVLRKHHSQER